MQGKPGGLRYSYPMAAPQEFVNTYSTRRIHTAISQVLLLPLIIMVILIMVITIITIIIIAIIIVRHTSLHLHLAGKCKITVTIISIILLVFMPVCTCSSQVCPPPYLGPLSSCSRLLVTAASPSIHTYSSQVHPSSCGRLWCCSCRVVCLVLFLLCVCVCDLFLFTSPPPSLPGPTLLLFTPALYSCISSYSHLLFTSAPLFVWSFVVFLSCRVFGGVLVVCLRV